jgi:hypothetical protein
MYPNRLALSVLLVTLIAVNACAPVHQSFSPDDIEYYETGKDFEPGLPYVSGDPRVIAKKSELERLMTPEELTKKVKEFSQQIEAVSFTGYSSVTDGAKAVIENPSSFELKVLLRIGPKATEELIFKANLTDLGTSKEIPFTRALGKGQYSISGLCTDLDCRENIEISLERTKSEGSKILPDGRATLYGRGYWANAAVRSVADAVVKKMTPTEKAHYDKIKAARYSFVNNWAIPFGISVYQVDVFAYAGKQALPAKFRPGDNLSSLSLLLAYFGSAAKTTDHEISTIILRHSPIKPSRITLFGDAASKPSRLFKVLYAGGTDPNKPLELAMTIEGFESQVDSGFFAGPKIGLLGVGPHAYLKTRTYEVDSKVRTIIDDLESNYGSKQIANKINAFTSTEGARDTLSLTYKRAYFVKYLIQEIYSFFRVPPPMVYIQLLETEFWRSPKSSVMFNPLQLTYGRGSTACGPSQIIGTTAQEMKMFIRPGSEFLGNANRCITEGKWGVASPVITTNSKGKKITLDERRDERVYPAAAICATARYMAKLSRDFEGSDQTFIVTGYYAGPAGVRSQACSGRPGGCKVRGANGKMVTDTVKFFQQNRMTFADMAKYNSSSELHMDYTYGFLAKYFISGNPEMFKIDMSPPEDFDVPPHLFLPKGWDSLNGRECEKAIATLPKEYRDSLERYSQYTEQRLPQAQPLGKRR